MEDQAVIIGERLRILREEKKLSQGDIEEKTGLLRIPMKVIGVPG